MPILGYILIGLIAGTLGGAFGIGGGSIMVPALVLMFGLTQLKAQGTSLAAMLPPVMILAVLRYYYAGNVNIKAATFIALGFIIGGFLGANYVQGIPSENVKKAFGIYMIIIGFQIAFFK
jgi:uncharacterized protein